MIADTEPSQVRLRCSKVQKDERKLRTRLLNLQENQATLEVVLALTSRRLVALYDTSDEYRKPWVISFIGGSRGMSERLEAEKTQ